MATNDNCTAIHLKLLTDISDYMEVDSREYESFIKHMELYVPKGVLTSKKTLLEKLDAMSNRGKLGVDNYEHLKKIAEDSGNRKILEMISEAEQKIKTIQTIAVPIRDASPSNSRALQVTRNIEQGTVNYDRISNVRNQNNSSENEAGPSTSKKGKIEGIISRPTHAPTRQSLPQQQYIKEDLKLIGEQIYYDPNKIIGTGSMSVVFEGRYGVEQIKRVAVKTILCADNEEAIYRNSTTITTLIEPSRDPNIVEFIHSFTDVKKLHIALELGKGTLVDYVKERNASWRIKLTCLNVNRGISEGLNYIHNKGSVHRDLRPPNIFIVERNAADLKAVIGDFGSAKATNGSLYSLTGRTGSLGFIAPEVYTAMSQDRSMIVGSLCNRKSDIFSTGLLLYYTISLGDNAFGHDMTAQTAIQAQTPPTFNKIDQIRNSFAYQSLIECMLQSKPEERPSAKTVLSHPANWSDIQILNYFTKKSEELENMITTDPSNTTILKDPMLIPNGNWMNNLPPGTQAYLKAYKVNRRSPPLYKGKETSIRSLLRVIRNTNSHYQGYPQNVQLELGDYPEGHVDLWLRVCPKLLMHVVEKLGAQ